MERILQKCFKKLCLNSGTRYEERKVGLSRLNRREGGAEVRAVNEAGGRNISSLFYFCLFFYFSFIYLFCIGYPCKVS